MFVIVNIKMVFEMGKSAPKWISLFWTYVITATKIRMAAIMIISRLRRLRSSEEIKEEAVLKRFRFMVLNFTGTKLILQ